MNSVYNEVSNFFCSFHKYTQCTKIVYMYKNESIEPLAAPTYQIAPYYLYIIELVLVLNINDIFAAER